MCFFKQHSYSTARIVGSVVECSPATRTTRVRFPDNAVEFFFGDFYSIFWFPDNTIFLLTENFNFYKYLFVELFKWLYFSFVPDGLIKHYDVPNNPPIPAIPPRAPRGSLVSFNSRQKVICTNIFGAYRYTGNLKDITTIMGLVNLLCFLIPSDYF